MKTYDQLTPEEKERALNHCAEKLLDEIMGGAIRFNDARNGDDLQARIDAAGDKANEMLTPWFWSSYIMDTCEEDIKGIARGRAEECLYTEPDEYVIDGIVKGD